MNNIKVSHVSYPENRMDFNKWINHIFNNLQKGRYNNGTNKPSNRNIIREPINIKNREQADNQR